MSRLKIKAGADARKAAGKAKRKAEKAAQLKSNLENAAKRKKIGQLICDLQFAEDCGYATEQRAALAAAQKEKENEIPNS